MTAGVDGGKDMDSVTAELGPLESRNDEGLLRPAKIEVFTRECEYKWPGRLPVSFVNRFESRLMAYVAGFWETSSGHGFGNRLAAENLA